jgi:hypothetical protein
VNLSGRRTSQQFWRKSSGVGVGNGMLSVTMTTLALTQSYAAGFFWLSLFQRLSNAIGSLQTRREGTMTIEGITKAFSCK